MLKGNDILVIMNGQAIAGSRSDELTVGCATIPISSPDTGQWEASITGRKSWGLTVGFLLFNANYVTRRANSVGDKVTIRIMPRVGTEHESDYELVGDAIITNFKVTATRGNLAQGTFQFQGTGPLEMVAL
jgi:predicted secreted protein